MKWLMRIIPLLTLIVWSSFIQAEPFPLPEGHYIPAKMPMYAVYPRPDTETQAHARHKWAYPGITYEIPIGVQGGAWPFKYQLIDAPTGATIGELHGSANYGTVNWLAPSSGTYNFTVRVTDQELNTIDIKWTATVDASMFVFIQDGWTGPKIGTIDQPLEDISDWYKGDENDSTYHNKIIVFRGGNYKLMGDAGRSNNTRLLASTKTPSLIAYPGEEPVIDASSSKVITDIDSLKDIFVAGITWKNARQDVNNAHFWWAIGDVTRATWWRNHWHNLGPGLVGNDNTSAVFVSDTGTLKNNILYKQNLHTEIRNLGYNGEYFVAYVTQHLLLEENIARNSDSTFGWYAKGTVSYVTIRANEAYDNVDGTQIGVGYGAEATQVPHHHEICWNRIRVKSTSATNPSVLWAGSNAYQSQTYASYIYRNTFINGSAWIRFPGLEKYKVDGNVVMSDNLNRWSTSAMDTTIPNLTGNTASGFVDSTGKLTGTYRNKYLGLKGFEVSASAVNVIKPLPPTSISTL